MTERGLGDHIGGVEPAAQSDFEQEIVGRGPREGEKGRRGRDLEEGDRLAAFALSHSSSRREARPRR